jgi:uncharacterized LabA/DUF88 family protein
VRSYCSLYVDAGYLLASAATRVTGTSLRNGIYVEYRSLVEALVQQAEEISGLPVLRAHWYDSAKDGVPDAQQERIGELPKVKLRLGRFGVDGQQKGVDLRIGLDLVAHARNGAASVFFLVSGDDDLTEAVEEAQVHGVQVVVLAIPNAEDKAHGISRHLLRAADELEVVLSAAIDKSVMKVEVPKAPPTIPTSATTAPVAPLPRPSPRDLAERGRPPATTTPAALAYTGSTGGESRIAPGYEHPDEYDDQISRVVAKVLESFLQSATVDDVTELDRGRPSIPREIDRALLLDLSDALGVYDLSDTVRFRLRDRFWEHYDKDPIEQRAPRTSHARLSARRAGFHDATPRRE